MVLHHWVRFAPQSPCSQQVKMAEKSIYQKSKVDLSEVFGADRAHYADLGLTAPVDAS